MDLHFKTPEDCLDILKSETILYFFVKECVYWWEHK